MGIIDQLSSRTGDRTSQSNREAATRCLAEPALFADIVGALSCENVLSVDYRLLGDCAEVCTMVAEVRPELVAPHAALLPPLLDHKKARVRWEAMHALALWSG